MEFNENNNKHMTEQKKQSIIEQLWLSYYNDTLYANGVITEAERNKMRIKIKTRTTLPGKQ